MITLSTPSEICQLLASRLRLARLQRNVSQHDLARMVGASLSTVRRFEAQGQGTLELAVRMAQALHCTQGLEGLFESPAHTLASLANQEVLRHRQRARKTPAQRRENR